MISMENYQSFSKADRSQKFRILFHHFVKRFLLILSAVSSDLMNKIASGPEFTVFVLMVIATHLGLEYRLVLGQFLKAMSEKTVESVHTETGFCETFAELDLAFILIGRVLPTDLTAIHHNLFIIYFSQQISSQSKKDRIDYD